MQRRRDVATGGSGQDPGEQAGLGQDQSRSGQAEHDGNHQVSTRSPGIAEQPAINRPAAGPATDAHAAEYAARQRVARSPSVGDA